MIYRLDTNKLIEGWMDDSDLQWLYDMACKMNSVVEIGSWKGKSTFALLSGCSGMVYAVDHFKGSENSASDSFVGTSDEVYGEFTKNVRMFENLIVYRMDSLSASKRFLDTKVDMVFLDGDHSYGGLKADIMAWLPKTKKLICGHDYTGKFAAEHVQKLIKEEGGTTVKFAVDELLGDVKLTESGEIWYKEI